jgi:hypothetical protein
MLKKDYLEQAIESFAQMVALILGKTKAGEHGQAQLALQDAAERYVGLSLKALDPLSFEGLRSLLRLGGSLDIQRCLMLADLRSLEGRLHDSEEQPDLALGSYSTAIRLYMEVVDERGFVALEDHQELADAAAEGLEGRDVAPEVADALERYRSNQRGEQE